MKRDLLETLRRDLSLIGLISVLEKPMTTWDFVKSLLPNEESSIVLNKVESYVRKVLKRWSDYGVLTKEVVNGRAIYCVDERKVKIEKKKKYWLMKVKFDDFEISFKVKPSKVEERAC